MTTLTSIPKNEQYVIKEIDPKSKIRKHLLEIGINQGSLIEFKFNNISNSLKTYIIKNTLFALRKEDSDLIYVEEYHG